MPVPSSSRVHRRLSDGLVTVDDLMRYTVDRDRSVVHFGDDQGVVSSGVRVLHRRGFRSWCRSPAALGPITFAAVGVWAPKTLSLAVSAGPRCCLRRLRPTRSRQLRVRRPPRQRRQPVRLGVGVGVSQLRHRYDPTQITRHLRRPRPSPHDRPVGTSVTATAKSPSMGMVDTGTLDIGTLDPARSTYLTNAAHRSRCPPPPRRLCRQPAGRLEPRDDRIHFRLGRRGAQRIGHAILDRGHQQAHLTAGTRRILRQRVVQNRSTSIPALGDVRPHPQRVAQYLADAIHAVPGHSQSPASHAASVHTTHASFRATKSPRRPPREPKSMCRPARSTTARPGRMVCSPSGNDTVQVSALRFRSPQRSGSEG